MGLVVSSRCVCSSNPLVSNPTSIGRKTASGISVTLLVLILILIPILSSVALPQLGHEVAIEHSLPHLILLLGLSQLVVLRSRIETSHSSLVEHLLLVQSIHVGEHLMDAGVVGGLKHDAGLGGVHLIYAQRPVAPVVVGASLLLHPVGHEESLVRFLSSKPIKEIQMLIWYLHSIHPLSWGLALCSSVVLIVLMYQGIS